MAERKTHKRSDVARGFIRGVGSFIEDSPYSAPPFCIACELVDKTALPHILQKTIWAIVNAISCIEKGEEGAYIRGIPGLKCIIRKNEKSSIIREVHGEEPTVLREVGIEIRIHEAKCIKPNGEVLVEHYIFLIASSPLAFSIRKAIYTTLQLKSRGQDAVYSDTRRSTWNMLATHVRQGLSLDAQVFSHRLLFFYPSTIILLTPLMLARY